MKKSKIRSKFTNQWSLTPLILWLRIIMIEGCGVSKSDLRKDGKRGLSLIGFGFVGEQAK